MEVLNKLDLPTEVGEDTSEEDMRKVCNVLDYLQENFLKGMPNYHSEPGFMKQDAYHNSSHSENEEQQYITKNQSKLESHVFFKMRDISILNLQNQLKGINQRDTLTFY